MSPTVRILFLLSAFSALLYLLDPWGDQALMTILTKGSVCLFLILMVGAVSRGTAGKLLMLALFFSLLGDIFLAIDRERFFIFGLGSFLLAHLSYSALFIMHRADRGLSKRRYIVQGLLLLFSAGMAIRLWPVLGDLKLPVFFYIAAITIMGLSACRSRFNPWLVVTGALSFILSDSLIAIDKFLIPFDQAGSLIWITYILGQYGLCFGILGFAVREFGIADYRRVQSQASSDET